jgi:hypothetical protein
MCKTTHPLTLARTRTRSRASTRLLLACGVVAAIATLPAAADVVTFDNSDGQFTWMWYPNYGNLLDPTLGPLEQDSADPARSYMYWVQGPAGSLQIVSHYIACGDNAAIARDTEPVYIYNERYEPYSIWLNLATRFYTPIGSAANWQPEADAAWFAFFAGLNPMLGQTCTVGIRLNLSDGVHYGFINLAWRPFSPSPPPGSTAMYQPVAWGYETEPDTPIMICEIDFNADGAINSQDFFDFLVLFFAADPLADFDHTGTVNSQDFFAYLDALFTGC